MAPSVFENDTVRHIIPDGANASFTLDESEVRVLALSCGQKGHMAKVVAGPGSEAHPIMISPKSSGGIHFLDGVFRWVSKI